MNNVNIDQQYPLTTPRELITKIPSDETITKLIKKTRETIQNILQGKDDRMLFIIGPCSIHNVEQAKIYASELHRLAERVKDKILIVMRTYFSKPRTTVGWKGLMYDPKLNGTSEINLGLETTRSLLRDINALGMPCGYEMLDTITPQYLTDLMSWGAIGARTTESQIHRELVSGVSMPTGFKNGTNGNTKIAIDAMVSAAHPHCFPGIDVDGRAIVCTTSGNPHTHIILRGGTDGPNYGKEHVEALIADLASLPASMNRAIIVDCSHGNSGKDYRNQHISFHNTIELRTSGKVEIKGVMLESNLVEGKQKLVVNNGHHNKLKYGVSITDSCISMEETKALVMEAYHKLP